jgi:seryl-tRNA synthetase
MIDPQLLRAAPEVVEASQRARRGDVGLVATAIAADAARRDAIAEFERLRAEQNAFGKRVASASKEDKPALLAQVKELSVAVKVASERSGEAEAAAEEAVGAIPNVVLAGVPEGGEDDYVVLREVGPVPAFDFEPRDHLELGELLGAIDMVRGAKVSGARFSYLRGVGARLELALMNLALDRALAADFVPLITPTRCTRSSPRTCT